MAEVTAPQTQTQAATPNPAPHRPVEKGKKKMIKRLIALGDGVRVESKTTPDYKVVGLKTWGEHRAMDLEALV